MKKMFNVGSGPAVYPQSVLEKISKGIMAYGNAHISILEIMHRSALFMNILDELVALTKELLAVPAGFTIMYLQGGGRQHLAQIPMNFLMPNGKVGFIHSGYWTQRAMDYSSVYGSVEMIQSASDFNQLPKLEVPEGTFDYIQYCSNNTIYGTQFSSFIDTNIPVVVDMSSEIFSKKIDFEKVDVVLACAQKMIGPAGLSLLIINNNLLEKVNQNVPPIFNYKQLAQHKANYNTPPIFQICACLEMLRWMQKKGGVEHLNKEVAARSAKLYNAIDKSSKVNNKISTQDRSRMNIVFDAINEQEEKYLFEQFKATNILTIQGHKQRGGFRVANYLAQSDECIDAIESILLAQK